jgi:hypothetical protein
VFRQFVTATFGAPNLPEANLEKGTEGKSPFALRA